MRRAFTLIELLLAVSLGALIVYVAFAGFRSASQVITAVNRMELENDVLRVALLDSYETADLRDGAGAGTRLPLTSAGGATTAVYHRNLPATDPAAVPADWPRGTLRVESDLASMLPAVMGTMVTQSHSNYQGDYTVIRPYGTPRVPARHYHASYSSNYAGSVEQEVKDFTNNTWLWYDDMVQVSAERITCSIDLLDPISGRSLKLEYGIVGATRGQR